MSGRKRGTKRKRSARRLVSSLAVLLVWGSTLVLGGVLGVVSHNLHRACRHEGVDGPKASGTAPYLPVRQEPTDQERKAAIIIDDLGPDMQRASGFLELEMPVTLAILPYRRQSKEIAREALRRGKEVLLHLPLQPRDYPAVNPGTGSLLLSMDREEIQSELAAQLDSLPYCVGVNSHMGSLFMEEAEHLRWVFSVLGERGLFFVDSLTTPHSEAPAVAMRLGIPFAQRTHFLDDEKTEDAIIRQLCRLVDAAVRDGGAIGIAHPFEETLAALPKVVGAFAQKGVRMVPVSEMVSSPGEEDRKPVDGSPRM